MSTGIRVLCVDRSDSVVQTASVLEDAGTGITVEPVSDPAVAFDTLGEHIDCIVSAHEPPETDGIELLKRVRSKHRDLPFVLFTDNGTEALAADAVSAGVTDYFVGRPDGDNAGSICERIESAVERYRDVRDRGRDRTLLSEAQRIAGVGAWECDPQTGAVHVTEETARIHDVSPGDEYRLDDIIEQYHPEDRPALRAAIEAAWAEGDPYDLTLRLDPTNGGFRWIQARGEARFEAGEPVCLRGSFQDVTERQAREQELRRYRAIVEALDDAVYAVDGDGRIEYVNQRYAEMKGLSKDELLGTPMRNWVEDETADRIYELIAELEQGDRDVVAVEYESLTADGERIPAELRATDLEFPDGQRGRVGVIRDITDRRERERRLERQNERLEEFTSVVSHDLRNPLNVASGNVELAREDCDSDRLDAADDALHRMDALIDDLLTLAQEGEAVTETDPMNLRDVATDCWHTVESAGVELQIDTDRRIIANEGRLKQLFENLFRNAVEHGTPGVTVTVGDLEDGFYVADDGPGIPETERDKVFENGYSTAEGGTGFGLAIVERVADAHGWTVRATEGDGGGARFEFTGIEDAPRDGSLSS